jgi:hypothetical protein
VNPRPSPPPHLPPSLASSPQRTLLARLHGAGDGGGRDFVPRLLRGGIEVGAALNPPAAIEVAACCVSVLFCVGPPTRLAALVARASRRGGGGSNLDMVGVVPWIWVPLVVTLVGAAEGGM